MADDLAVLVTGDEDAPELDVAVELSGRVVGELEQIPDRGARAVEPLDRDR